ncbi:transposase [Pseudohongiella sp. SYSU M77423]|uniref:P-loop ATPase, Sll1717 family n=1 Tax=Pseudohongiella sp. SYSU M77423 TaxID=3042312 RepID=UPI0024805F62|nr:transposase [Pseudohongiella sp. SYSU M77423]MDH7943465.1 transposase [Pseudohongiella sp. SYSU M77423]
MNGLIGNISIPQRIFKMVSKKRKEQSRNIQLPKDALKRIKLGEAFAEYDIIRSDPQLFVTTPSTISSMDPDSTDCFYVGRRGAGKTAITFEVQRKFKRSIHIIPQIFDLLVLPLQHEEFLDTRQRPFKSLMHSMERALVDEVIKVWQETGIFSFQRESDAIRRERGLIEDCDFDVRVLNLTEEIFDAYSKENDKLWLRQINRSKEIIREANAIALNGSYDFILLIDRLDESWDGSDSAIICLMAMMHAAVRLRASTSFLRPYIFIRENIYDRIRAIDNEFSRLETSSVFLDWTDNKLIELVERRLVRPFSTKPALGGDAWGHFFEEEEGREPTSTRVLSLCQHRPRDILMLCSYAIDNAINIGHTRVKHVDLDEASVRYSTSRLKDLGDEYAENYPNISLVLEYFYGLGNQYTVNAIEDFIQKLLINDSIKKHCKEWFFRNTTPYRFVEVLYGIGFVGIQRRKHTQYKGSGMDSNAKPAFDNNSIFEIHPTYQQALNLRSVLISDLKDETTLKNEGILEDIPESFQLDDYKMALELVLRRLRGLPSGRGSANEFEQIVGDVIKLCFFRSLTNIQISERTADGTIVRDWVASNRATGGFWDMVRTKYGATQVVWECKNYTELKSDDFHQIQYYLNDTFGRFGIIVFRGEDIKESYLKHVSSIANKNRAGLVILLTQKDLEVFLRQSIKGAFKESHIQDRHDYFVRKIS